VLHASASLRELLGYSAKELRAARWTDLTHPEDRAHSLQSIQSLRHGTKISPGEPLRLRHHEGHPIPCHVYLALVGSDPKRAPLLCQLHVVPAQAPARSGARPGQLPPEQLLQQLGDNLHEGCIFQVVDNAPNGPRFQYLSSGVERLTEQPKDNILGNAALLLAQVEPADRTRLENAFLVSRRDHSPVDLQLQRTTPSGHRCWTHLRATPTFTPDGGNLVWAGVALDITERKVAEQTLREHEELLRTLRAHLPQLTQTEAALRRSEERYRAFVENSDDVIFQCSPEGQLLFVNAAGARLIGRPAEHVLGRALFELVRPEVLDAAMQHLQLILQSRHRQSAEFAGTMEGHLRVFLINVVPLLDAQGTVESLIGMARDITDQRRTEQVLLKKEMLLRETGRMPGLAVGSAICANSPWCCRKRSIGSCSCPRTPS
jgi:PAS domain S-box-containing protein